MQYFDVKIESHLSILASLIQSILMKMDIESRGISFLIMKFMAAVFELFKSHNLSAESFLVGVYERMNLRDPSVSEFSIFVRRLEMAKMV